MFWNQDICGVATVSTQKRHKAGDFGRCAGAAVRAIEEGHEELGRKPKEHPTIQNPTIDLMQGSTKDWCPAKSRNKNCLVSQRLLTFPAACSYPTHEKQLQRGANPNIIPPIRNIYRWEYTLHASCNLVSPHFSLNLEELNRPRCKGVMWVMSCRRMDGRLSRQHAVKGQTITRSSRPSIKASAQHHETWWPLKSKPYVQKCHQGAFCWLKASNMNKRLNSGKNRILSWVRRV